MVNQLQFFVKMSALNSRFLVVMLSSILLSLCSCCDKDKIDAGLGVAESGSFEIVTVAGDVVNDWSGEHQAGWKVSDYIKMSGGVRALFNGKIYEDESDFLVFITVQGDPKIVRLQINRADTFEFIEGSYSIFIRLHPKHEFIL